MVISASASFRQSVTNCLTWSAVSFPTTSFAFSSVSRLDDDEVVDVSGYWNDSDIAIVCDSLIEDCLSSSWTDRYRLTHGGDYPFIIIGDVLNNSSEHIDTAIITKKIEVALINNGINVVADIAMRDQIVAERKRQQYV